MAEPTALLSDSTLSMAMQRFNCESVELRLRFKADEMDVDAFLAAADEKGFSTEPDDDGDREITEVFPNENKTDDYHAHFTVRLWKNRSGNAEVGYYTGAAEGSGEPPLNADNCVAWLGGFFMSEMTAHLHINYKFGSSFIPAVSLNFPLTTSDKALAGTMVSGLALMFPSEPKTTAIIQSGQDDETHLFLRKTISADLKAFHLFEELEKTVVLVNRLVSKLSDESGQKKTE